jgi:PAS domain S-box-containing protein
VESLAHTTAKETDRFRTLYQLLADLSQASAFEDVFEAALTSLLRGTAADRAAILLFDDDGVIRFKAARMLSREYQEAATGHSPWFKGMRNAKPIVIPDTLRDESLAALRQNILSEGIAALAFVPIALEAGVLGKFMLYYDRPHHCSADELEVAGVIATHVALAAERKRAELARARTEQTLRAILDNSSTVIFLKDLDGRYQLVNRRYEELFHVTSSVIGKTDYDIFPVQVAESMRANDREVLAAGRPLAIEEVVPQDDGDRTYLSFKFPMPGPDGGITGVCGIATDITERNELEAANQHLAAIVQHSNDAIIGKNLDGIITTWNQGAERIFGYTAKEVIGAPGSILIAPDSLDEIPELLAQIQCGQKVEQYEARRRRKDGDVIDVALTLSPVRAPDGRIVGVSKIARDITGRKRAEDERAALLAREKEARQTAEMLNQVGPRLAVQLDGQKLVQEVTDIATELVGAEFGAFFHNVIDDKGKSYMLYTLSGVPREAFASFPMPRATEVFAPTFRGQGVVRRDDITQDSRYGKNAPHQGMPEGHLPVRSYLAVPVMARSGEVLGALFFGHSLPGRFTEAHEAVTTGIAAQAAIAMDNARLFQEAERAQTELKRTNDDLRRANQDLEVFAYSASHDLQEPLRTISLSAQIIERDLRQRLEGDDGIFLTNIIGASKRMSTLIADLLAYTRATKFEDAPVSPVNSGHVLAEVLETLRGVIEENKATVTAGDLPNVAMHETRLAQLFQNLIGNAIKYRRSDPPEIRISAADRDGRVVFSIVDNGIGIEPHYAQQIFGLFQRLHERDEYDGSGIGLAICQRVVEQYEGRIWLENSTPGEGSTFCFSIPSRAR